MVSPSGASFSLRCLIYKVHAVPGGTLLLYVVSSRLSRTFFKSFWRPVRPVSRQPVQTTTLFRRCQEVFSSRPRSPAATALLEYHPYPLPVNPFFHLFPPLLSELPASFSRRCKTGWANRRSGAIMSHENKFMYVWEGSLCGSIV